MPNVSREEIIELIIDEIAKRDLGFSGVRLKIQYSILYNYFNAKLNLGAQSFTFKTHDDICPFCKDLYDDGEAVFDIERLDVIPQLCNECVCIPLYSTHTVDEFKAKKKIE